MEVDLLALGDGRQLRQRIDGAKVGTACHADQRQHLQFLLFALDQRLLQRSQTEPVLLVGLKAPDAAGAQSQQIHPLVEGVVHQPGAQNDGAAIALLIEGKQVVAAGAVAGQPQRRDVGDGATAGHDAEGCILGMHLLAVEGIVPAIDEAVQLGQHLPLQKAEQAGGLHLHRILVEHHQQARQLGGIGWQGRRHVAHVAWRGEVRSAGHQSGQPRQIVLDGEADRRHAGLIELMGELVALVGGLTVIRVVKMCQHGAHCVAKGCIRLCKQLSQLHQVLQTRSPG